MFAFLMLFLCVILHTMSSCKSLQGLCIFPFCMCVCCETVNVDGDSSAGMGFGGGVVGVSAYIGDTRCSGVLASAGDMLEISVV